MRKFSQLAVSKAKPIGVQLPALTKTSTLLSPNALAPQIGQTRGLIKFSLRKGKRKSVKAVVSTEVYINYKV